MGTIVRLDRRSTPASRLAETGMELGENGRLIAERLRPLQSANPWLRTYLEPLVKAAVAVERDGRRIAGMAEATCADGARGAGHGRAA